MKIQTSEEAPAAVQGRSEDSLDLGGSSGGSEDWSCSRDFEDSTNMIC